MVRVVTSPSASARLEAVREFLSTRHPAAEVVIVGASRGAADDVARSMARSAGATFGLTRFSLTELAARAAVTRVEGARRGRGTQAGTEAVAARVAFEAMAAGDLEYFGPVATLPGFPKALARTLHELRLTGRPWSSGADAGPSGDVARLLERFEAQLAQGAIDDRAAIFRRAAEACDADEVRWARLPIVLLDVPLDSRAEQSFVVALASRSPFILATVPEGDSFALHGLGDAGAAVEVRPDPAKPDTDLYHLRRYVFAKERPAARGRAGDVAMISAPGEGRESIEIVRRILAEAGRGVPFDEIAVFLRAPQQYLGLLEHACARGEVPVYFDRGTRRPDPSGRAFSALLSCAVEGLSAKRFDEYLSLGQVPRVGDRAPVPAVIVPEDDGYGEFRADGPARAGDDGADGAPAPEAVQDSDEEAVIAGTLRSPWKWEELIVESAVVGGGESRWRRRLDGLAQDFRLRMTQLENDEPDSPRLARYHRDLRNLAHLRQFALPIVDELSSWPADATWGEWFDRFTALAARALRRPLRVLQLLADLRPMAAIGPVRLEHARDLLHERLVTLDWQPPARRYGRVFVGTPHQARGRTFRVVFVPGLAERIVPQRPREDPLLVDDRRREIDPALVTQEARSTAERLLLKVAIGAATDRLYLSYPRLDVAETRARVPSFYALDVMRAITGQIPDHQRLADEATEEGGATLAWPAPKRAEQAIDDLEHDLATLRRLLDTGDPRSVRGHAHYLLGLNPALRRSVISRWARDKRAWSSSDGLVASSPAGHVAIQAHRLDRREYSLSALQRFATCPYQFLLATIYRLQPWDEPEPLMRMDPLTRGSLFHAIQARFFREMAATGALPVRPSGVADAVVVLNAAVDRVAAEYAEKLAPAIARVWEDEIGEIRRDLSIWVQKQSESDEWTPAYFEFSFGLPTSSERDPRSLRTAVVVGDRFRLHGAVDLIERHQARDVLRVTDHKTGRNRSKADLVVDGGRVLQPVLYAAAVERALGRRVEQARLYFATTAGGFAECQVPLNDYTHGQGLQVLSIIDRAVEQGFLVPAPAERACAWCDFRPVCGPREEDRVARKSTDRLLDLDALRSMR